MQTRKKIIIKGIVQAVGFRPFVYNLARKFKLRGHVANTAAGVVVQAQGPAAAIKNFTSALQKNPPKISKIESIKIMPMALRGDKDFYIKPSRPAGRSGAQIPADIALCPACARDLADPKNRRYQYPFTNCALCGPRYTIIKSLPYDRAKTTMAPFKMCPACRAEFDDPRNRRFHAQPNCCPVCGPKVEFIFNGKPAGGLAEAAAKIKAGKIVAIKSIGGFHLACSALNAATVARLRQRKNRPHKPLALMFGNAGEIKKYCRLNTAQKRLLKFPQAPVVMLRKRREIAGIAPGFATFGVMLPYTPLHRVLFDMLGPGPLVMTSGNITGQPICIDNAHAQKQLGKIADGFLLHNREIYNRVDDSVLFELEGQKHFLRRARGYAPGGVTLRRALKKPALAMGADISGAFALGSGKKIFLSQYIGDLDTRENQQYYNETLAKMQKLLKIRPQVFARDTHPAYYGATLKPRAKAVQHHLAHALAVAAEHGLEQKFFAIVFDGAGLGSDGNIWGGEFLIIAKNTWRRVGHLKPVQIVGGDSASKEIWKCALSYLAAAGAGEAEIKKLLSAVPARAVDSALAALAAGVNTYTYTGAGRLFDAAASALGFCNTATHDAQGPMLLEGAAMAGHKAALKFHREMAQMMVAAARKAGIKTVVLAGGVFQNKLLLGMARRGLKRAGFKVFAASELPPGDGALAVGQLYAAHRNFV